MAVIVPIGECTATMIFGCAGIPKEITYGFGVRDLVAQTEAEMAENIWHAAVDTVGVTPGPHDSSFIGSGWAFSGVQVARASADGPVIGQYLDTVSSGTSAAAMPVNCAVLLNKNTALGGRRNRGRAYIPPTYPAESEVSVAGLIGTITLGIWQASFDLMFTALADSGLQPVLHHSDGSLGTPITGWTLGSTIATQRRRLR